MERAHSGDDENTGSLDDFVVVVEVTGGGDVRVVDAGVRSTDAIALPGTTVQVDRRLLSAVADDDDVRAAWESRRTLHRVAEVEGARYDVRITPLASGDGDRLVVHVVAHDRPERMRNIVNAAILDALPTAVALLDADSVVRSVNAGWVRYTLERPDDPLAVHPGERFRDVLDRALAADPAFAGAVGALRSVLDGAADLASADHPPKGTDAGEWYTLRAVPVGVDDERWTVLALEDVSALRHALERWHSTFSGAAVPTVIVDRAGRIADANSAFAELVGVELRSAIGRSSLEFVHQDDRGLLEDRISAPEGRLDPTPAELRVVRSDGAVLSVQAHRSLIDPDLRRGAVVQLLDRTEQRRAEERLALHRELLELVAAGTPLNDVATAVALNIGRAIDRATGAVVLPGWAPFVAPGARAEDLAGGWSVPVDRARLDRGELVVHTPALEPRPDDRTAAELLASVVRLALQRDETAGATFTSRDTLRDLPTADVFLEELRRALEWAAPREVVAVLAVAPRRIDHGGWREATTALAELTAFVRSAVRAPALVARRARHLLVLVQAGDERALDEVRRELEHRNDTAVGIAVAAGGSEDGAALVEEAEEALAAAQLVTDEDAAAADLRRGIDAREITVHYQPIVDLRSGATVSLEALVRWRHPTRGFVPPPELIHTAETCGLVHEIGALVLTTACRDLATFKAGGAPDVSVAVNLSARQLAEPELVPLVRDALGAAALDPSSLVVEITESVLVDDVDVVAGALAALRDLGVKVAIDDFGTGYSSLLYLKRFPADVLKVDRSFVQGLGVHEGDTAIVDAVVGLGHRLGLEIVAEGVETGEQLAELRRRRCDHAQGDLLQRPAAAVEVGEFLGRGALPLGPEPEAPAASELGVDELLSVVSHELSTPLAVIGGHAELLAESLRAGDDRPSAIVDAIERNIKHLDELLRSLSGLGHAFGDPGPRAVVDLGPFVDQVVRELGPLLAHHHVRLDAPDAPVTAEVEPVAVRQVLTNLLSNAAKFTAPGTAIDVTVRRGRGRHEVVVADHGPGVPPERAHELFGRFARLGATARGLGLGLHLSRTLARRQGGDLVHERTPGGGATFVLRLPA